MKALKDIPATTASSDIVVITTADIRAIVSRIIEGVHPDKIFVFGSRARGEDIHDYSDLDILVVMETDKPVTQRSGDVVDFTFPRRFPMDIIVYTPEEFEKAAEHPVYYYDPFIKEVLKDGIVLYDKSA